MVRLKILDGLRVIAILIVMLFHYLYLFNNKYYDVNFIDKSFFKYGYLGVQLFFIISGFVITMSLTKSNNIFTFLKKRWSRLFPAMLFCSFLTFIVITLFDTENLFPESKRIANLIISNTFIAPSLINPFISGKLSYIDPPYWSLWVEIQFYILIGIIYFLNKRNFIQNFIFVSIILSFLYFISHDTKILPKNIEWFLRVVLEIFNFSVHALWFVLGVLLYKLYFITKDIKTYILISIVIFLQLLFSNFETHIVVFTVFCILIFYCFLYNQKILGFLTNSIMQKIGISSYAIYLLHQNMGILIINKVYINFGNVSLFVPILIMIGFSIAGVLIYKYFEKPFGLFLKNKLSKN